MKLQILVAGSECVPFSKTGGLADVMGVLPKALVKEGVDARVITPMHYKTRDQWMDQTSVEVCFNVQVGRRNELACIRKLVYEGVIYYFVDNEYYFKFGIYKGGEAEREQYAFFSKAILEALSFLEFKPDVLHLNDWHTGMIPLLLKTRYGDLKNKPKTVFSIHNLQYQGQLRYAAAKEMFEVGEEYLNDESIGVSGDINMMKAGILYADKITTVSPTYAKEILTEQFGEGLHKVLSKRKKDLCGILNGIDEQEFDPKHDKYIYRNYAMDSLDLKYENKRALIKEKKLKPDASIPLIGMVTRMTEQKGLALVAEALKELMKEEVSLVILGSGDELFEEYFLAAGMKYPQKLSITLGYDEGLGRKIYAGSDFFLMPSRFEPCGLAQMIAQRYGTLPIVHRTGGLADTIISYDKDAANSDGFAFSDYGTYDMLNNIRSALELYKAKDKLNQLIHNAMSKEYGFSRPAKEYIELYEQLAKTVT